MKKFKIKIDPDAIEDIQGAMIWYNNHQEGLGKKYFSHVRKQIESLASKPLIYAIRYDEIRCVIVPKFPFMIHYSIDSDAKTIHILAVLHTSRNPQIWKQR